MRFEICELNRQQTTVSRNPVFDSFNFSIISRLASSKSLFQSSVNERGDLALLFDSTLKIFSHDSFSIPISCPVDLDSFLHLRLVTWSLDSSLIAVSFSDSSIQLFKSDGSSLGKITAFSFTNPAAFVAIVDSSHLKGQIQTSSFTHEIFTINYYGELTSFLINTNDSQSPFSFSHSTSFSSVYKLILNGFMHPITGALFLVGVKDDNTCPVTEWSLNSSEPYYRCLDRKYFTREVDNGIIKWVNRVSETISSFSFNTKLVESYLSPDGKSISLFTSVRDK